MNLFVYEKLEEERQMLPFGNVAYELHSCHSYPYYCGKNLWNVPQELKTDIVCCVPWIQILEPLSFLTKVLNAVLAEKFKSMLN